MYAYASISTISHQFTSFLLGITRKQFMKLVLKSYSCAFEIEISLPNVNNSEHSLYFTEVYVNYTVKYVIFTLTVDLPLKALFAIIVFHVDRGLYLRLGGVA